MTDTERLMLALKAAGFLLPVQTAETPHELQEKARDVLGDLTDPQLLQTTCYILGAFSIAQEQGGAYA